MFEYEGGVAWTIRAIKQAFHAVGKWHQHSKCEVKATHLHWLWAKKQNPSATISITCDQSYNLSIISTLFSISYTFFYFV